jgi:hypothetical protein
MAEEEIPYIKNEFDNYFAAFKEEDKEYTLTVGELIEVESMEIVFDDAIHINTTLEAPPKRDGNYTIYHNGKYLGITKDREHLVLSVLRKHNEDERHYILYSTIKKINGIHFTKYNLPEQLPPTIDINKIKEIIQNKDEYIIKISHLDHWSGEFNLPTPLQFYKTIKERYTTLYGIIKGFIYNDEYTVIMNNFQYKHIGYETHHYIPTNVVRELIFFTEQNFAKQTEDT